MYELVRKVLRPLPDKLFLQLYFFKNMKRFINFKDPKTFNEKIQWLKVNDRNPLYTKIADKYEVRQYVKDLLGEEYLIPMYGVYNSFSQIDFDKLPEQFVIKCTHDSGSVVVCRDKKDFDIEKARQKIQRGMGRNAYEYAKEWQYKNVPPRIIVEKYLQQDNGETIIDYKFFCFNGEPKFFYVSQGLENHATASISFYDLKGNRMPFCRTDYPQFQEDKLPILKDQMIALAQKSAKNIPSPFIRVDFYEIGGKIYFSEFTLHPCSGVMPFRPKEWDNTVGEWLRLDSDAYFRHSKGRKKDAR